MSSIDDAVRAAASEGVAAALAPHLRKLHEPEPITYTLAQAGVVIGCSDRKVASWVTAGILPRVPGIETVLIPRVAVEAYALGLDPHDAVRRAAGASITNLHVIAGAAS